MYKIIEDCSPYYIRFTHENIDKIINRCNEIADNTVFTDQFTHHKLGIKDSEEILSMIPMAKQFFIQQDRVSLFVTKSGKYYRAHKDGPDQRIGFNYNVRILDQDCETCWYSEEDGNSYPIAVSRISKSRESEGFDKSKHTPLKTMIAQPNEAVLFNTDMWHDFDNRNSANMRILLTLRLQVPQYLHFDHVKKILFGI